MRAFAVALVLLCAVARADAPAPAAVAVGFDHRLHDRDVQVSGADSIACARCHALKGGMLVGRPGHAACFGACHGEPPKRGVAADPARAKVCTACHAEAALATKAPAVFYPPYRLDADFATQAGHKAHRAVACAECHSAKGTLTAPHARCATCHDGRGAGHGPPMTACSGCHAPASGHPLPPQLVPADITVKTAFSHAKHAARGDGARCATCHAAVLATDDNALPRPTAATCATARCHDGAAAFPITAACTKCHRDEAPPTFKVARPDVRFSHAAHDARTTAPCTSCHALGKSGEVLTAGHAGCADAKCHGDDFGLRAPKICGACHNATEPWRPLAADRGPRERTEFGATLDHGKHAAPCASCHSLTTPTVPLRPPLGHRACSGATCHAVATGPAPRFTACDDCHQRDLVAQREADRLRLPWSVRATFDHVPHARTASGEPLACTACHDHLDAPTVLGLAAPAKATCAPCHDGQTAFKLTGTACTKCHPGR